MSDQFTVTQRVHFRSARRSRKSMRDGDATPEVPAGRIPRVSRLMSLAIRFEQLIDGKAVQANLSGGSYYRTFTR